MATTKKRLISLLSNTTFQVDYKTQNLTPQIELVLLSTEPKYEVNKKSEIMKGAELSEFRIFTSLEGINQMIGELQSVAANLQKFEQLSVGINGLIESAKVNAQTK